MAQKTVVTVSLILQLFCCTSLYVTLGSSALRPFLLGRLTYWLILGFSQILLLYSPISWIQLYPHSTQSCYSLWAKLGKFPHCGQQVLTYAAEMVLKTVWQQVQTMSKPRQTISPALSSFSCYWDFSHSTVVACLLIYCSSRVTAPPSADVQLQTQPPQKAV